MSGTVEETKGVRFGEHYTARSVLTLISTKQKLKITVWTSRGRYTDTFLILMWVI